MATLSSTTTLYQDPTDCQAPPREKPLAHHNPSPHITNNISVGDSGKSFWSYGVPSDRRILSPGLFNKRYDLIRLYLVSIGLTAADREAILRLLRLYCYYGRCYPKAAQIAEYPGCSKRSFWRAIAKLANMGLIEVANRFHQRRQISNTYRLDKLVAILARFLAEHGQQFTGFALYVVKCLGSGFWQSIGAARVRLVDPVPVQGGW
ncbi:hypothetical protein ES703_13915 [subsurface metagenome]